MELIACDICQLLSISLAMPVPTFQLADFFGFAFFSHTSTNITMSNYCSDTAITRLVERIHHLAPAAGGSAFFGISALAAGICSVMGFSRRYFSVTYWNS